MVRALALLALVLAASAPAVAHAASSREELAQTREAMEQAKTRKEKAEKQARAMEAELVALSKSLVETAQAKQQIETSLSEAEARSAALSDEVKSKRQAVEAQKKRMAALTEAAISLSKTPPEAVVLMPGDSEQAMKAARALKMTTQSIREASQRLAAQLAELEGLQAQLDEQRKALRKQYSAYEKERLKLESQLAARRALQQELGKQAQSEAQAIARLGKQAETLEKLVQSLEVARKADRAGTRIEAPDAAPKGTRGKLRSFAKAKGSIRPPASGRLVQRYGDAAQRNETSKGLVLLTRPGASVTSPYDGEVVYAGTFLNYGRMVIIRHSDDFHTLLAGLARIDAEPGQFLLEGEPIGAMGEKESTARLYVELRRDNQPVDPFAWMQ
jgi:septal ring factor EnvC (AmiA/AmiB activator)